MLKLDAGCSRKANDVGQKGLMLERPFICSPGIYEEQRHERIVSPVSAL